MRQITAWQPAHKQVRFTGGFWAEQLEKIRTVTVWDVLTKFENDHEEGIMKNYEWVAEGKPGEHVGPPWYDGLICEVIRGISDFLSVEYDKKLDDKIREYTKKISAAQDMDPDGYINTYTTLICPDRRWGTNGGSLIWQHETYNMGCLVEAGVHYYLATGNTELLKCGIRAANCLCKVIGPAPRKNIVPAHSLAEEAILKLYRLFTDEPGLIHTMEETWGVTAQPEEYLSLVRFWMDHRGVHGDRYSHPHYMGEYAQDHCRITEQSEVVGHAVRAALMYTGLTALGMETEEENNIYLQAARRLWDNMELTKLHISGGIGAIHNEERFGYQYDLPNDAYLETCAGVALAFWAGRMHEAFGDGKYMDVLECAVMNNVLPCLGQDGTHYFYENPLISNGDVERWSWHGCPCCPPMFLKIMGCLQDYIYSTAPGRFYVNLHAASDFTGTLTLEDGTGISLNVQQTDCTLPWEGDNTIALHPAAPASFTLAVRRPAWSGKMQVTVNGVSEDWPWEKGYFLITRQWQEGDLVQIHMKLPAMKVEAHPYVQADVGRVALMRGPLLYCLEEADNPQGTDPELGQEPLRVEDADLHDSGTVSRFGSVRLICGSTADGTGFTAVPYYLWNNRGKGTMNVWIRQQKPDAPADITEWEGKLYRRYQ